MSRSEARQRGKVLNLRCTEEEVSILKAKAKAAGISTSDLLRRSALDRQIMTRTDTRLMNELLRLGGLQKHLFTQMQSSMTTELSKQFADVLVEIKKAVVALDLKQVPVSK